ncbi:MAG: hypothetical protein KDD44_06180, partial [Bdellovibrionales bacterium]|nr:hypothetical protein [Bdellovibrionales bacterium]
DIGPFQRVAVLELSKDRRCAEILYSVGDGLSPGMQIDLHDPLCPLATCLPQVKSFNAAGLSNDIAPLGITSYAVSPLDIENDTPIALYADCGDQSVPFEARRVFRYLIELLNNILPNLERGNIRRTA